MSGSYDATFPRGHENFVNSSSAAPGETSSNTFTEDFGQTSSTENVGDAREPYSGAVDMLSPYMDPTRAHLEHLTWPPAFCVYYPLLDPVAENGIVMIYPSQQMIFRHLDGSPPGHWPTSQNVPQTPEHATSPEAPSSRRVRSSLQTVTHTPWQPSMLSDGGINVQTSHRPTGTPSSRGSPQFEVDHSTPSTSSELSSDPRSSPISIAEVLDLHDGTSQPDDSPQSTYRCTSHPRLDLSHRSGVLESPGLNLALPTALPQQSRAAEIRIVMVDPGSDRKRNKRKPRTPCPKCPKTTFQSRHEFVKHMEREHEKPVTFVCSHHILSGNGDWKVCFNFEYHISACARHHTLEHPECTKKQSQHVSMPECRQEIVGSHPVKHRGCWLCEHLSLTVEDWVDHLLSTHRGCPRSLMSQTWAMKSLLSHPDIELYWQIQIRTLEVTTGYYWNLQWPNDPMDPIMVELVKCLETGFFRDKDFHKDSFVRAQVAEAAMDATLDTREVMAPIPPQRYLELEIGLNNLRRELAMAARSEIDLSPTEREVQRVVSSSVPPLSEMRGQPFSLPQTQRTDTSAYFNDLGFEFNKTWTSHLITEE